jgi:hypothetical protein
MLHEYRKERGLQFHIDDNLPPRVVDDVMAFAMRHDLIPVIGQELIQICQRILQVQRFALLCLLVVGSPDAYQRTEAAAARPRWRSKTKTKNRDCGSGRQNL